MFRTILYLKMKSLKSQLQYPFNFIVSIVGMSAIGVMDVLLILLPVSSFGALGGWSFWELGFMFSLWKISHGIHQALFIPFWNHDNLIRNGEYDRLLVRPVHPILQILSSDFSLAAISEWIPSVTMFFITATHAKVTWNGASIAFFLLVVFSGAVIEWSISMISATFGFWTTATSGIRSLPHSFLFRVNNFPAHIYGRVIAFILTFVFPYAFMSYYPTHYFFNLDVEIFGDAFAYATPIVAMCIWIVAYTFYTFGLRQYKSTGT